MNHISIIGLGYVGLPLALQFARSGITVTGLDIDDAKVTTLQQGRSYIRHVPAEDVAAQVNAGRLRASTDFTEAAAQDALIICVPTPLKGDREPDLSYVLETGRTLAPHLRSGMLVVLESTTYPGTTEDELRAVLEEGSGLRAGRDFHLAYSPEREDPGNPDSVVADIPKVIGGYTPECLNQARALYSRAIRTLVPVSSCRAAEAVKLLENIFRAVNIALVNELKTVYSAMDVNVWEVIEAAKTKPFGYMAFQPGPGLGGHCIPIDPFYLAWKARQCGETTRFIELAGEVNAAMPAKVVDAVASALEAAGKQLSGSRVLLLGLAYKANVDDVRESPSFALWDLLEARGAQVAYHDPHVPVVPQTRDHAGRSGVSGVDLSPDTVGGFDCVLIATGHAAVDYTGLANAASLIVDTRNAMATVTTSRAELVKA